MIRKLVVVLWQDIIGIKKPEIKKKKNLRYT